MPPGPNVGAGANTTGWVQRGLREGWSKTRTLGEFRAAGGAIRRQRWFQIWNSVVETMARRAEVSRLPPRRIPDAELFAPFPTRGGKGFLYQATITVRDRFADARMTMPSAITYNRRVSPGKFLSEIEERAQEGFEESEDYKGLVIEEVTLSGLFEMVSIDWGIDE